MADIQPAIDGLKERIEEAKQAVEDAKKLPEAIGTGDIMKRIARFQEIRQELKALPLPESLKLLNQAAETGRVEIIQAADEAPFPIYSEEQLAGVYDLYLRTHHKDLLRRQAQFEEFQSLLDLKLFSLGRGVELLGNSNFK